MPRWVAEAAGDQCDCDDRGKQRKRDDPARGIAHAPWQSPPGGPGQRAQHARHLTGGLAGAGGLEREHLLEVGDHARRIGIAAREVLGDGAFEHRGGGRGEPRAQALHVGDVLAHVLHRDRDGRAAVERDLAGEHLEQHDAERVQV